MFSRKINDASLSKGSASIQSPNVKTNDRVSSKCGSIAPLLSCYLMMKITTVVVKINRCKKVLYLTDIPIKIRPL